MAEHDEHSSFIKTPQQLIMVVVLAFVLPIVGIVMVVQLVINRPQADPGARAGMKLAIIDVLGDQLAQAARELEGLGAAEVLPITADLSKADETQRAAEQALERFGAPRVLVHNAALCAKCRCAT